jgi:hypothetical protein
MTKPETVKKHESARAPLGRAQSRLGLTPNVTATVTTGAEFPTTTGNGDAAGSGEAGYVRLRGQVVSVESDAARAFTTDCARNIEGLKSDRELQEDWGLDEPEWARLAENAPLLKAVKAQREQRVRSGEAVREAAQEAFVKAPAILSNILTNETISPRHRIEAAKELRQVAGGGRENTVNGEKFTIIIDLGDDHSLVKEFYQPLRAPRDDGDAQ